MKSSPKVNDGQKSLSSSFDAHTYLRSSTVSSFTASQNSGVYFPARPFQDLKRTRSPELLSTEEDSVRSTRRSSARPPDSLFNYDTHSLSPRRPSPRPFPEEHHAIRNFRPPAETQRPSDIFFNDHGYSVMPRTRSPPPFPGNNQPVGNFSPLLETQRLSDTLLKDRRQSGLSGTQSPVFPGNYHTAANLSPLVQTQRPSVSPPLQGNQVRLNYNNSWVRQDQSPVLPYDSRKQVTAKNVDAQILKRTRSPPLSSANEVPMGNSQLSQIDSKRPAPPPPMSGVRSNNLSEAPDPELISKSLPSAQCIDDEAAAIKPLNSPSPKRTRSPPLPSTDQAFQGNSSMQDAIERELQAKAKRLARFKVELSQPAQSTSGNGNHKFSMNRRDQSVNEKQKSTGKHLADMAGDFPNDNVLPDIEGSESSTIIIGLCPDMCPESEREERERKGDLDQYERLDGDRNQTSKSLAVKKYNRTAEREPDLIRPMPVLQKTIDYLLHLLHQPYDEKFLGLYNFLWDRMRAIRMDLRMQHIFNLKAIKMLEQMIRLHIIAMHELCEYTKGEGFSEGFDAHLNIEQMNKTSVELFQLYDDHRKKEIQMSTEKEFRGYYALLKLDKHPGYKVEPAELSLDLSNMTPEIRQTPDVLFARDVARACRTGNFIAFFRLARKASYLQACLMHAHFAKLRTQALACLHGGLQNSQGIPVSQVAKWLAMEDEDIGSLLEYHGFPIKEFEEPYMVKGGPFLNSENDYPVKRSKLVYMKKSKRIVEDVLSPHLSISLPAEKLEEVKLVKACGQESEPVQFLKAGSPTQVIDEEMDDFEAVPSPRDGKQDRPMVKALVTGQQNEEGNQMPLLSPLSWDFSLAHNSPRSRQTGLGSIGRSNYDTKFRNSLERKTPSDIVAIPCQLISGRVDQEIPSSEFNPAMENSATQNVFLQDLDDEEHSDSHQDIEAEKVEPSHFDEEVAEAKVKLILRMWKRHASRKRELREQRQLASMAALSSLSLGPPIRQNISQPQNFADFNIDLIMNERFERHERSWSRLNVSDVIAGTLRGINPAVKCFCWKMVLFSQMDNEDNKLQEWRQGTHFTAGPWLLSKIMPVRQDADEDLIISSAGLSIWKKWVHGQSDVDLACCLSIVRNAKLDSLNETLLGASAVLFLVSESISLEIQKFRLHKLLTSVPSGSRLPLLVIMGSHEENSDSSSIVAEKLGLNDMDKSRVCNFSVVFLAKRQQLEKHDGFFSDEQLRGGLQWLASQSPLQPAISYVKTDELVLTHLNTSLEVLNKMSAYEVGPDHCIAAFNEAMHQAMGKVAAAAGVNPSSWPCPELTLLEKTSDEYEMVKSYLPDIGWSSSARIEQLISALRETELPAFRDDLSWLHKGSNLGRDIENQKVQLENCLIRYLTQSSKMMGLSLATNEAHVMLQKNARLELHNSTYYIIPNWMMIFQRIFNWRIMSLSAGPSSTAYVLDQPDAYTSTSGWDKLGIQNSGSSPYYLDHPSLDEMVEVGCGLIAWSNDNTVDATFHPPSVMVSSGTKAIEATDARKMTANRLNLGKDANLDEMNDGNIIEHRSNDRSIELVVATKEADKLSKLLEQCNILQDLIDRKLSIYF
ncbi:SAC3 family protein B isoform X2 [Diospyros lotus]|nr:SAC3 family protein B isoform X2 [Diospyros lotus]